MTNANTSIARTIGSYIQDTDGVWTCRRLQGAPEIVTPASSRALRCDLHAVMAKRYGRKTFVFEGKTLHV